MEFDLKKAVSKSRRMRDWRVYFVPAVIPVGLAIAWYFNFARAETLICMVGALAMSLVGHLEIRLKTMQLRLAKMADEIDALRGKEPEENYLLELNVW